MKFKDILIALSILALCYGVAVLEQRIERQAMAQDAKTLETVCRTLVEANLVASCGPRK